MTITAQDKARILSEALPHMQQYDEETVVIKYGGHAMGSEQTARDFAQDVVLLEQTAINPVVVHGGGPQIQAMLEKLGIKSEFAAGLRITDEKTIEIVEMVLAGSINKQIVGYINAAGGKAIGLCGKDGNMVQARKVTRTVVDPDSNIEKVIDLGFVGDPEKVDTMILDQVIGRDMIPVLAPVATSATGGTFNVNADTFAGAVAGALKAKRLLLLTDVPGVLDKNKKLIEQLSVADARKLIADGTISGGMIPKVETCIYALDQGVEGVVILDGKVPHAVLLELADRPRRRHADPSLSRRPRPNAMMLRLTLAIGALALLAATPARAALTLCNHTSYRMDVALGLAKQAHVSTRGWFRARSRAMPAGDRWRVRRRPRLRARAHAANLWQRADSEARQRRVLRAQRHLRSRRRPQLPAQPAGAVLAGAAVRG